jgi:hypothetical protein
MSWCGTEGDGHRGLAPVHRVMKSGESFGIGGLLRGIGLAALLAIGGSRDLALAYLDDPGVYPPINESIFVPPARGSGYEDPAFGTTITRISDALNTPNAADTGTVPFIVPEYATVSPFNSDRSRLILVHHSYFGLYDGDGHYLRDLPLDITSSSEPRWSRSDPDLFYYLSGNLLKQYDVATGTATLVCTFSDYARVSGGGENDLSEDGTRLVLAGDSRFIFVYNLLTGARGAPLDTAGLGVFNDIFITPDDNVLVGWDAVGTGRYQGVELYDGEMRFLRQAAPALGHMDVTRDTTGDEVLLIATADDPQGRCGDGVAKIRLADARWTCLVSFDWSVALHISAPDGNGWFVVSTYDAGSSLPPGPWTAYRDEILEIRLDGSEVRRLAHHRSRPLTDYWWQPHASVSRDGSRLVYGSNAGLQSILGAPAYDVDSYLIDLTSTAPSSAGSQGPAARRFEEDAPATVYTGAWYPHASPEHSGGTALLAMDAGARAAFTFVGSAVHWIGFRDAWSGIARVSVDGVLRDTVDTYAPSEEARPVIEAIEGLGPGPHTLAIEPTGLRNPVSGGSWIWIDAFDATLRSEQDGPAVAYAGAWGTDRDASYSGGSAAGSVETGASATFTFAGTSVSWIGDRDDASGIARVLIDGVPRAEIDTYAPAPQAQARIYTLSGLPAGIHTLTIEVTGSHGPLATGARVRVDAFETPS